MVLYTLDIAIFLAFIVIVVCVGMLKSKRTQDSESYFLAGRGLQWWLIGISLIAANISTEQFVGMSGSSAGYMGLAIASYEWMAAVTLVVVGFFFLPYFLRTGIYTIPEFLEYRYNHWARGIMAICTMIILIGVTLAAVIYSGALTMSELFSGYSITGVSMNLTVCCWLIGIMAAIYVASGGLKACAWADLIQGTALIAGGAIILWFALSKLGSVAPAELTTISGVVPSELPSTGFGRLLSLNGEKLHMVLPQTDLNIPWTALVIGLWIPNFYYWGLNQYITQRVLGSASLSQGQKGIVFAAGLKLIIPFIIVIPGMIAFNLFSADMAEKAVKDPIIMSANEKVLQQYEEIKGKTDSLVVFAFDRGWATRNMEKAKELEQHNLKVLETAKQTGKKYEEKQILGYKYDSALSLLIGKLIPSGNGLQGFILAALLGAVVSSLAAVLNAASTIFTMDIYHKYLNKNASQNNLVMVGRICVGVFVVIGCLLAPLLGEPRFGGIFKYIQEFQGYVSPGILAVFVFGLINRRAPGFAGVTGLILNPILYGIIAFAFPNIAFLDRMAICFFSVIVVMAIIAKTSPMAQPVQFISNTSLDLQSSTGAKIGGIIVVILTLLLYVLFF